MPKKTATIPEYIKRVFSKTLQSGDCLIWQGSKCKKGYGRIIINKKLTLVHRFIARYVNNFTLEFDDVVMHTCDTPSCVNPNHLVKGKQVDNIHDMIRKNRKHKKLCDEERLAIKNDTTSKTKELAEKYGVAFSTIQRIRPPLGDKKKYGYKHRKN